MWLITPARLGQPGGQLKLGANVINYGGHPEN